MSGAGVHEDAFDRLLSLGPKQLEMPANNISCDFELPYTVLPTLSELCIPIWHSVTFYEYLKYMSPKGKGL